MKKALPKTSWMKLINNWYLGYKKLFDQLPTKYKNSMARYGLLLIPAVMYAVRAWQYISNPQFYAEDGAVWLSSAYNHGFRSLVSPDNGFAHSSERLFAFVVSHISLSLAPLLFDLTGFVIFLVMCWYLFSERVHILTTNYQKLFMAFSLGLIANFSEFYFNFSNAIFLLGIVGLCVYIADPPSHKIIGIFEKLLFILVCLTLPFAWFFLLIVLLDYLWRKKKAVFYLLASVFGSLVQLAIHEFGHYHRSGIPLSTLLFSRYTLLEVYNQIITPSLRFARFDLSPTIPFKELLAVLLFSVLLLSFSAIIVIKHGTRNLKYLIIFLVLFTVASLDGPLVGGGLSPSNILKFMDTAQFGNRYFFYGILGLLIVFAVSSSIYIKRQAQYAFLSLFIVFGLIASLDTNSFKINKEFVNDSPLYSQGLHKLAASKPGTVITIPENPSGWVITLRAK